MFVALFALLTLAGCWNETREGTIEDKLMAVTYPRKDNHPNPHQIGPNEWRLFWKSDIVKGDNINLIINLNGGKVASYTEKDGYTLTFVLSLGHGFEVDDICDAHWIGDPWIDPDPLVTFGLVITDIGLDGVTVQATAASAYGGLPQVGWTCSLAKTIVLNTPDFEGRDITRARFVSDAGRIAVRPMAAGDVECGEITVNDSLPAGGRVWQWEWADGIAPAWKLSTIYKMRISAEVDAQLTMYLVRGGPRYRVWLDGKLVADDTINFMDFHLNPEGERIAVAVEDQSYLGPAPMVHPYPVLSWNPPSGGEIPALYRVERSTDGGSTWSPVREVAHMVEKNRYTCELSPLSGSVSGHDFRVTPVGANRNEGTPVEVSVTMERFPEPPHVSHTFSDSTKKFTIEEVS